MGIHRRLLGLGEDIPFEIKVQVTAGQVFTLPIGNFAQFTPNFLVDWGDGTSSTVTSATDSNRIHTYTNSGQYIISITGFMPSFRVNNNTDIRSLIIEILEFGSVGLRQLDFHGCNNITSIPTSGEMENEYFGLGEIVNFTSFMSRTGVTQIPSDIFSYSPNATTFTAVFSFTDITQIPSTLFSTNVNATIMQAAFQNCLLLDTYDLEMFDTNINIVNFSSVFRNCISLTEPLQFTNNTAVTNFSQIYFMPDPQFFSNSMAGTAPELWNRVPEPFGDRAFRNCNGLTNFNDVPINWK
jgi:hypothetical protein